MMSHQPVTDEMARQLRTAWFTYIDTIERFARPCTDIAAASPATCGTQKTCYRRPCFEVSVPSGGAICMATAAG